MQSFEWDENKARTNYEKHGIKFDEAIEVFFDEFALFEVERFVGGEARWQVLGMLGGRTLLLVVHTVMEDGVDEIVRIISARRVVSKERRKYEQNRSQDI